MSLASQLFPRPKLALESGARVAVRNQAVEILTDPDLAPDSEEYRLVVAPEGTRLTAGGELGVRHGLDTLRQWIELHPGRDEVGGLRVEDRPDFPVRGVMLDVSRDKVPKLETLFRIVERLASWRINQLQLYFEHTFAYAGHEAVCAPAGAFSPDEVRSLDEHCAQHGIELVPNQNSFGHMHRWLVHEPYRRLAEVPEGVVHAFSKTPEPYGLCPTDPASLEFLGRLYDQLLTCFRSRLFNVGLDETIDLGLGRSAEACRERGKQTVYLEFLRAVHGLVRERGRRMMFWGDIVLEAPERIAELPEDAIAVAWGYEADHPFAEQCAALARSGLEFWVAPGTSSWNSLGGRLGNAIENLCNATRAGREHGARGVLTTDWGDHGHLQPWPVAWPALLTSAALSWNADDDRDWEKELPDLLDRHAFDARAPGLGEALCALGRAHEASGVTVHNNAAPFLLLHLADEPLPHERLPGLTVGGLEATRWELEALLSELEHVPTATEETKRVQAEITWAARLADLACELGLARLAHGPTASTADLPPDLRADLRAPLRALVDEQARIWQERNRAEGLSDSSARLERVAKLLG